MEEYTLEQFSTKCHRILKQDAGVEGRKKVCALIQQVLKDDALIASNLSDDVPERKVLYEDPELGFCILATSTMMPKAETRTTMAPRGQSTARPAARRSRPTIFQSPVRAKDIPARRGLSATTS